MASRFLLALLNIDWMAGLLPAARSVHGAEIDRLFIAFLCVTSVVTLLVLALLVIAVVRYRDPTRQGPMIAHGVRVRTEIVWIILSATVLIAMTFASQRVWRGITDTPADGSAGVTRVLVIGQQFKWNFVYAGPDNHLGRYGIYPRPTDARWPAYPIGDDIAKRTTRFQNTPGPSALPYAMSVQAINAYIEQINPLGKDFDDPAGLDDDYVRLPGRPLILPAGRPVEVSVMSKDVIHSFFLPDFRVKMDAVPGRIGRVTFEATTPATTDLRMDDVAPDRRVWIDSQTPTARSLGNARDFAISDPTETQRIGNRQTPVVILRNLESLNNAADRNLRRTLGNIAYTDTQRDEEVTRIRRTLGDLGLDRLTVIRDNFEIVCEELCGGQHYAMRGELILLNGEAFDRFIRRRDQSGN